MSQKTSDVKRNDGEVWRKPLEARSIKSSVHVFRKYTPTRSTKATQQSRSVEQLTDNVHLATSALSIYVVWIGGIPQSIVYLPHSDKFIGYQFTLHSRPTRHQMMEAARRDKNGELQSVPWSVGRSFSDETSALRGSPNQPIRRNQKHRRVFLKTPSRADNWEASSCWRRIFEVFGQSSWSFVKHRERFAELS